LFQPPLHSNVNTLNTKITKAITDTKSEMLHVWEVTV